MKHQYAFYAHDGTEVSVPDTAKVEMQQEHITVQDGRTGLVEYIPSGMRIYIDGQLFAGTFERKDGRVQEGLSALIAELDDDLDWEK